MQKKEKLEKWQKVRIARKENLGNKSKEEKGKFIDNSIVIKTCRVNSYLVKNSSERLISKKHYDLKS